MSQQEGHFAYFLIVSVRFMQDLVFEHVSVVKKLIQS